MDIITLAHHKILLKKTTLVWFAVICMRVCTSVLDGYQKCSRVSPGYHPRLFLFETLRVSLSMIPAWNHDHRFSLVWEPDEWELDPGKIKLNTETHSGEVKPRTRVRFSKYSVQGLNDQTQGSGAGFFNFQEK